MVHAALRGAAVRAAAQPLTLRMPSAPGATAAWRVLERRADTRWAVKRFAATGRRSAPQRSSDDDESAPAQPSGDAVPWSWDDVDDMGTATSGQIVPPHTATDDALLFAATRPRSARGAQHAEKDAPGQTWQLTGDGISAQGDIRKPRTQAGMHRDTGRATGRRDEPRSLDAVQRSSTATALIRIAADAADFLADRDDIFDMARAAGALATKKAEHWVPLHSQVPVRSVSVSIETHTEGTQAHARTAATHRPDSNGNASTSDAGFSTAQLLDADAWVAAGGEGHVQEASSPPGAPSNASASVQCVVASCTEAPTEAMAGCMAACLTILDMVEGRVAIERIEVS